MLLTRKGDGCIQRSMYREKTYNSQYTNFHNFLPARQKRSLIKRITLRAMKICSPKTLRNKLNIITNVPRSNGYPAKFIRTNVDDEKADKPEIFADKRKGLFIRYPYKGDCLSGTSGSFGAAIRSTFNVAKVHCSFKGSPLLCIQNRKELSTLTTFVIVCSFGCLFGALCIGRTAWRLSIRIKEHCPL